MPKLSPQGEFLETLTEVDLRPNSPQGESFMSDYRSEILPNLVHEEGLLKTLQG